MRGRSSATLSFVSCKVGHLVRIFGAHSPITAIDARAVDDYCRQRISEGASRHTVAHELGQLRAMLRLARRRGEYHRDPIEVLPLSWESGYEPRRRSLTPEQLARLMAELPDRAPHLAFMVATGARLSESLRARPEDFAPGLVHLRGTKTSRSNRLVPVLPHVAGLVRKARLGCPFRRWPNVRRDIYAACARAGVPKVSPNDLRRSAATWLVERGAPSNLVGALLGHTSSRMVERVYGRVEGEALGRALIAAAQLSQTTRKTAARSGRTAKPRKRRKT